MSAFVTHGILIIGFERVTVTMPPYFMKVGKQRAFITSSKDH
jgi:hypothetical protein